MNKNLQATQQLKNLHDLAMKSADSALDYARQAGEVLLVVKKELRHGQFTAWVQGLGFLDIRMAQRYMSVASGKPYTLGGRLLKNDAASFLDKTVEELSSGKWTPVAGHWYISSTEKVTFWLVPWSQNEEFFHISKLYQTEEISLEEEDIFEPISHYIGTISPIPASLVEERLKYYGLKSPADVEWKKKKKLGEERPFGEPENYFERLMNLGKAIDLEQSASG